MEEDNFEEAIGGVTSCGACNGYGCSFCTDWYENEEED